MSIMDKLKKNSKVKTTEILAESKFFNEKDMIPTEVPMMNVALAGSTDGGLAPGLTVLAGPSKHFKTSFALIMASAYLKKYNDAVLLFYDSEFGSPEQYFKMYDIDTNRVLHTPITNVEELKFDIIGQMEGLDRKDNVIIVIDSIGNLASKKEMEDAINERSVADMSRAKALKGLFRMCTPYLNMKIFHWLRLIILTKRLVCSRKQSYLVVLVSIILLTTSGLLDVVRIKKVPKLLAMIL